MDVEITIFILTAVAIVILALLVIHIAGFFYGKSTGLGDVTEGIVSIILCGLVLLYITQLIDTLLNKIQE